MSDYNDLARFATAKLSTAILAYPSGRFGLVGSVPYALSEPTKHSLTPGARSSLVWETEEDAIAALLAIGITHFQRADCTWYDA